MTLESIYFQEYDFGLHLDWRHMFFTQVSSFVVVGYLLVKGDPPSIYLLYMFFSIGSLNNRLAICNLTFHRSLFFCRLQMKKVVGNPPTSRAFIILLSCGIISLLVVSGILLASGQEVKITRSWITNTVNDLIYLLQFVSKRSCLIQTVWYLSQL